MSGRKKTLQEWRESLNKRHSTSTKLLRDVWSGAAKKEAKIKKTEVVTRRSVAGYFLGYGNRKPHEVKTAAARAGNFAIRDFDSAVRFRELILTWDDEAIKNFSDLVAHRCKKILLHDNYGYWEAVIQEFIDISERYGLEFIYDKKRIETALPLIKRRLNPRWWHRQLRKVKFRIIDNTCRRMGMVSAADMHYCSDEAVRLRVEQLGRNRAYLESVKATNNEGQEYFLSELSDVGVSNPRIRRNELMTRMSGFESVADKAGHVGIFWTITAPSFFHPVRTIRNAKGNLIRVENNPRYGGGDVRDAQKYICKKWAAVRARWKRNGLQGYGFRVVEPHADGTPHWHMLMFFGSAMEATAADYFLRQVMVVESEYQEPGADRHRVLTVNIDKDKGRATGYIAKYISKNIDGHQIEKDLLGNDAYDSAVRINAWASGHSVRQFQQIGGPGVQVWRELRRMADEAHDGLLAEAIEAACAGDWDRYCQLQGGVLVPRDDQRIRLGWWWETNPESPDELLGAFKNQYGEDSKGSIFGVMCDGVGALSRFYTWTLERLHKTMPVVRDNLARLLGVYGGRPAWQVAGWSSEDDYLDWMRGDGYACDD